MLSISRNVLKVCGSRSIIKGSIKGSMSLLVVESTTTVNENEMGLTFKKKKRKSVSNK